MYEVFWHTELSQVALALLHCGSASQSSFEYSVWQVCDPVSSQYWYVCAVHHGIASVAVVLVAKEDMRVSPKSAWFQSQKNIWLVNNEDCGF